MTRASEPDAVERAVRALRTRDHTATSLDALLEHRGVAAQERADALVRLRELGYLDDERVAHDRARALAARGRGDLLIAADLERRGVPPELAEDAIGALEPEADRATAIVAGRGHSVRTARLLASRGFASETIERVVAGLEGESLG